MLGAFINKVDFAPFHRSRKHAAKTRKAWAHAFQDTEPYEFERQHAKSHSQAGQNGQQDQLFSFDMLAAIRRQQSFPFQVCALSCSPPVSCFSVKVSVRLADSGLCWQVQV